MTFAKEAYASGSDSAPHETHDYQSSIENAFTFQNTMMDAYATGDTLRLIQSYSDQSGLLPTAMTCDNAVSIHACLLRGQEDDLARAEVLGNGLLYARANNFPFADGRFAQGNFVNSPSSSGAYITPAAAPFCFYTSAAGDQAWAGMALAQLYRRTGQRKYLNSALLVANWIVVNTYNTAGFGGYSFGTIIDQYNQSEPSPDGQSTEHNIDTCAFFTMLDELTNHGKANNGSSWASLARHALSFVLAMYNSAGGYFYTGTDSTGGPVTPTPIPEDCQSWSYLALLDNRYRQTIDWALANLRTTDTPSSANSDLTGSETITGMVFDTASLSPGIAGCDPHAVWLEGTAHTIAALIARASAGNENVAARFHDIRQSPAFLANCRAAQSELGAGQTVNGEPIAQGEGLLASTSLMDTGFGYTYGPLLHVGATGWYLLAALGGNPFQPGYFSKPRGQEFHAAIPPMGKRCQTLS
ncbi:MAG TPA: hypothetical protein VME18_06245 [Acidobacteriaceae bacterium]|nr:hypothetical protein [Acidobacteriaceae bacterium]